VLGEEHPETLTNVLKAGDGVPAGGQVRGGGAAPYQGPGGEPACAGPRAPRYASRHGRPGDLYTRKRIGTPKRKPLLTKALETSRRVLGPAHATTRSCAVSLAKLRLAQQKYAEAEDAAARVLEREGQRRPLLLAAIRAPQSAGDQPHGAVEIRRSRTAAPGRLSGARRAPVHAAGGGFGATGGERIVQLYGRWGQAEKAAVWRQAVAGPRPSLPAVQ